MHLFIHLKQVQPQGLLRVLHSKRYFMVYQCMVCFMMYDDTRQLISSTYLPAKDLASNYF